jgi:tRNA threonylcarbamoyladenosine biosynthesis protein TsaE
MGDVLFNLTTLENHLPLAEHILQHTTKGSLVILSGPLGVGKTTLTQTIAKTLGSQANVTSPTYTLIHEYPTPQGLLIHMDAYRLNSAQDLFELGLEDYLERSRLVLVEWGEGLLDYFPEALHIQLLFGDGSRIAKIFRH